MKLKLLFITIALSLVSFGARAQNQWDGDNPTGNFSFCNNWYSDSCPSAWNGSTDLLFQFRNSPSQTSLYFDLGGWRDVRNLQFNNFYGQSTPLNGDGNGFNIYGKLENNSFWNQTINVPTSFKGSTVEINAVNADMVINSIVYNSNNRAINVFGPNGKLLTFNNYIEGNSSVALNINQYSLVAIAHDMTGKSPSAFSGGVNITIGELWINSGGKLNGGTITLGGNNSTCKLYINATNGTQVSNPIVVANNAGSTQIIGSFRDSGTNEYSGSVTLNRNVTFETAGGGTTIFTGVISGNNNVTINNLTGLGVATIVYNSATSNTYTGLTTINSGTRLRISTNQTLGNIALNGGTLEIDAGATLTITGTYSSTGGTIDNKGTIKFAGGSVIFPGSASVNNGTANTMANIEVASSCNFLLDKTLEVSGTIKVSDFAILDTSNHSLGGTGTNLTMTGSSKYRTIGSGSKPDASGTYLLDLGTTIEFYGTSATDIRYGAPINYANIIVNGTNVSNAGTANGIRFKAGGTFVVKNGARFNINTAAGFTGGTNTGINTITNGGPTITLEAASTIEYAKNGTNGDQVITPFSYSNLSISGTGTKTLASTSGTMVGNNLAVNASTLRIESGKALTVTNNVIVNPAATMTINDSGSLVQVSDSGVNAGNIRYERTTPPVTNTDYTYWSSPVEGYTLGGVSKNLTVADKYYSYNSTTEAWDQKSASTLMDPGIGYIIRGPEPTPPNPPSPANFNAFFVGKPNNGEYKISGLSADKSYLLGNPYPSALDAEKFLNDNAGVLNGTLYFWTHNTNIQLYTDIITAGGTPGTGVLAYTSDDYATYNATGGVAVNQRDIDPDTGLLYPIGGGPSPSLSQAPSGKIATGQGFFASTKTTLSGSPPQILYNNSMRVGVINISNENNSQFFKTRNNKETTILEKHRIWLNLRNTQGVFKQTLIGYLTDATNQYDNRFDGISFDANEFADFYSVSQDKNLVIQGRALPFDKNDEVPLGFRTTIDGSFTINIDQTDGVLTNQSVFIEDKLTNAIFDLRTGPYTFTTKSGTYNDRFVLRYTNKTLGTKDLVTLENQVLVSSKNKQIKVNSAVEIIDKVTVYDLLGRQLFKKVKVSSNELAIPNLVTSQQTLLVKVSLQNGQTITKKIMY